MLIKAKTRIGPRHQGRRMPLKAFEFAEIEEGYRFELSRGVIVMSEVPNYSHAMQIEVVRDHLRDYKRDLAGSNHAILGSSECKLLIAEWESERHPDLSLYLVLPTGRKDRTLWRRWIPEIAIEIVSPGSVERDYVQKREEYWTLGIKEYWIIDALAERMTILKRGRSEWNEKELGAGDAIESKLLPGFKLACQAILEAADKAREAE